MQIRGVPFAVLLLLLPCAPAAAQHPLDSLTAAEIQATTKALQGHPGFPHGGQFVMMVAKEPSKSAVLAYAPETRLERLSFSVVLDRRGNRTFEAVVDVNTGKVVSWKHVAGVQPLVLAGEGEIVSRLVKADPRWQSAMTKRNITDFTKVQVDLWATGQLPAAYKGRRMLRALSYFKGDSINFYGQPIEGVVALVDLSTDKVVEVADTGVLPLPPPSQQLDEKSTGTRVSPKPLIITQPDGASFEIVGQEVRWQKWRFRYSMHPREGLVLHTIAYDDQGRLRSILYRASLSEMVVPYGDADRNWRWRAAFDVGEYSVGRLASSIEPKTDAPENATLIDATFAGDDGAPYVLPRAIGIYERDGGMLWKHYEGYSGTNESRRARQLVIFSIATIGNYDYAVNWIFHQDGVLEVDAALSGIMLPKGVRETTMNGHVGTGASGHLVAANVVAPHHQHFFSFRLDFDVDGPKNVVHEMNTRAATAGPGNPALNAIVMEETRLASESVAGRKMNMQAARTWQVLNTAQRSALGYHPAYIIVPGANSLPYIAPASQVRRRAGFINNHFWATRYHEDELSAAGTYPNQSAGGDGLPRWTANNESLVDQDVVVWYTLGVTHIPRPEEWPVMPVTHVGFKLIPGGFFTRNPALDVPR